MTISQRKNVFISYSHTDLEWLKRLQVHLKPLEREGAIEPWSDEKIQPGSQWRKEIKDAIKNARVAVLLVSADFLASDFIYKDELPPLLTAAKEEDAVILPVILSPCRFEQMESISKFQAVNTPKKTLLTMSKAEQEEVFVKVADAIVNALKTGDQTKHSLKNVEMIKENRLEAKKKEKETKTLQEERNKYNKKSEEQENTTQQPNGKKGQTTNRKKLLWLLPSIIGPLICLVFLAIHYEIPPFNRHITSTTIITTSTSTTLTTTVTTPTTTVKTVVVPTTIPPVVSDMVHITGGWFDMGSSDGEEDEKPLHQVYVNDFSMGKYEVKLEEFREFARDIDYRTDAEKGGGSYILNPDGLEWVKKADANWLNPYFQQTNKHPAVCVSWNNAITYCNWRSKKEGLTPVYTISDSTVSANFNANGYRLPTEAEWEYAARCGAKGNKYSWGDGEPAGKQGGNIADETLKRTFSKWKWDIWKGYDDGYVCTAPVGSFDPNEFELFKLHDMTGNVWEWCWDWYDKDYYKKNSPMRNPQGPSSGASRVVRGGAWSSSPFNVRAANRFNVSPDVSVSCVGFRLSRTF